MTRGGEQRRGRDREERECEWGQQKKAEGGSEKTSENPDMKYTRDSSKHRVSSVGYFASTHHPQKINPKTQTHAQKGLHTRRRKSDLGAGDQACGPTSATARARYSSNTSLNSAMMRNASCSFCAACEGWRKEGGGMEDGGCGVWGEKHIFVHHCTRAEKKFNKFFFFTCMIFFTLW